LGVSSGEIFGPQGVGLLKVYAGQGFEDDPKLANCALKAFCPALSSATVTVGFSPAVWL
jgi:hypothetical protein